MVLVLQILLAGLTHVVCRIEMAVSCRRVRSGNLAFIVFRLRSYKISAK